MGLTNMLNLRYLVLAVNQIQSNDHPPLGSPKGMTILPWHTQGNEVMRVWQTCQAYGTWTWQSAKSKTTRVWQTCQTQGT